MSEVAKRVAEALRKAGLSLLPFLPFVVLALAAVVAVYHVYVFH